MSLRVWLPFNDSLIGNNGLDMDAVLSTSGSINTSSVSILGNGSKEGGSVTLKKNYLGLVGSVCFWVYIDSSSGDSSFMYFGNNELDASVSNRKWSLFAWPGRNDLHTWGCMKDSSTSPNGPFSLTNICPDDTWTHVAWCHDKSKHYLYINGELINTTSWDSSGTITFNETFPIYGQYGKYMNDFRIYDHCLSVKEVKELSRGLICHYKLDSLGDRVGNKNYLKLTSDCSNLSLVYQSAPTYTTELIDNGDGTKSKKFTIKSDTSGWHYTKYALSAADIFQNSEDYTLTFWLKTNVTKSFQVEIKKGDATGNLANTVYLKTIGDNEWHKYVANFTTKSDVTVDGQYVYIYGLEFTGTFEYKLFKLERSTESTDWCPALYPDKDPDYTYFISSELLSDSSGYITNNYSSNLNSSVITNDTIINRKCLKITSSSSSLDFRSPWTADKREISKFSISFWAAGTKEDGNFFGIAYNNGIRCRPTDGNSLWFLFYNGSLSENIYLSFSSSINILDGNFHHYVITFNEGVVKLYIDGKYLSTKTCSDVSSIKPNSTRGVIGSFNGTIETQTGGKFSDFRIYSTILDENDALELYGTRESIDKVGNLYSHELIEGGSSTSFGKNGIITADATDEVPVHFDTSIYTEEDGTKWVRIFHHNNPTSYLFSSTDPALSSPFYKDSNRWWNMNLCSYLGTGPWEIMVKEKQTTASTEVVYRWIQYYNPMTATYAQVAAANIDKNTDYDTILDNYGGIYKHGTNTFICANNGTSGNWWGGIGCWTANQGGIPGYNSKLITTGYLDVYVRVSGLNSSSIGKTSISKYNAIYSNSFIEN